MNPARFSVIIGSIAAKLRHWIGALVVTGAVLASGTSTAAETITYYYTDPLGTVLATADASGNVLERTDYRPYGVPALGAPSQGPGYTGQVTDVDTELVYMQGRYYDPSSSRFIGADPSPSSPGELFSFNRFAYADGNPIRNLDSTGNDCEAATGGPCTPPPPPPPSPDTAPVLEGVTVTATVARSLGTSAIGGSEVVWAGGLVTLGAGLYLVDSNYVNELISGRQGCYGSLSCDKPWLALQKPKKVPKPGVTGKEGAKDVPSWVRGERPNVGESGKDFADRLWKEKQGRKPSSPQEERERRQIQKWGDRAFVDP